MGLRRARELGLPQREVGIGKSLNQLSSVVDLCLADRPSAHTEACMEKKAQEIWVNNGPLTLPQMTHFTSPSMGMCVEQWELTAVGVEIVTAPVLHSLQSRDVVHTASSPTPG